MRRILLKAPVDPVSLYNWFTYRKVQTEVSELAYYQKSDPTSSSRVRWDVVTVTAEAPAPPRSWRVEARIAPRAFPRTSRRQPGRWGWWPLPRWSPARRRVLTWRRKSPGNTADSGAAYSQLRGNQRDKREENAVKPQMFWSLMLVENSETS